MWKRGVEVLATARYAVVEFAVVNADFPPAHPSTSTPDQAQSRLEFPPDRQVDPRETKQAITIEGLLAGLAVSAPIAPLLMIAATVAFVLISDSSGHGLAVLGGFLVGGMAWLIVGVIARSFIACDSANRSVYRELTTRVAALDAATNAVWEHNPAYYRSVRDQLNQLKRDLMLDSSADVAAQEEERLRSALANTPRHETHSDQEGLSR